MGWRIFIYFFFLALEAEGAENGAGNIICQFLTLVSLTNLFESIDHLKGQDVCLSFKHVGRIGFICSSCFSFCYDSSFLSNVLLL